MTETESGWITKGECGERKEQRISGKKGRRGGEPLKSETGRVREINGRPGVQSVIDTISIKEGKQQILCLRCAFREEERETASINERSFYPWGAESR